MSFAAVCSAFAVPTTGTVQFSSVPGFTGEWNKDEKRLDFPTVNSSDPTVNAIVVDTTGDFNEYFLPFDSSDFSGSVATFYDFDYDGDFAGTEAAPATIWSSEDIVDSGDGVFGDSVSFSMTSITKTIEAFETGTTTTENGISTFDGSVTSAIDSLRIFGEGIITVGSDSQAVNAEMTFEGGGNLVFSWSSTTTVIGDSGRPVPDEVSSIILMVLGLASLTVARRRKTT